MARTRHTVSGVIDENTPDHILNHSVLGRYLEVVDEDAKPYLPVMHKPREADGAEDFDSDALSDTLGDEESNDTEPINTIEDEN